MGESDFGESLLDAIARQFWMPQPQLFQNTAAAKVALWKLKDQTTKLLQLECDQFLVAPKDAATRFFG